MNNTELKPCPFCGEKPDHYVLTEKGTTQNFIKVAIRCAKCNIEIINSIPSGSPMYRFDELNQLVVKLWNRRTENDNK